MIKGGSCWTKHSRLLLVKKAKDRALHEAEGLLYKIPERMRKVKQCGKHDADRVETTKARSPVKRALKD